MFFSVALFLFSPSISSRHLRAGNGYPAVKGSLITNLKTRRTEGGGREKEISRMIHLGMYGSEDVQSMLEHKSLELRKEIWTEGFGLGVVCM